MLTVFVPLAFCSAANNCHRSYQIFFLVWAQNDGGNVDPQLSKPGN